MIDYAAALKKLRTIGQEALLEAWDTFSQEQKDNLLLQIDHLDTSLFLKQQALIHQEPSSEEAHSPLDGILKTGDSEAKNLGIKAIEQGLVGVIVVAGGQGTRLGFPHPKGMFPITKMKHKSLFQLLLEKVKAASTRAGRDLPIAIMTSEANDQETREFLERNHFFGAPDVSFFSQGSVPLLSKDGNLFFDSKKQIAHAADGNGSSINCFAKSPIFKAWIEKGVKYVLFTLIDNPLADPFDAELIGHAVRGNCDAVIKAIEREDPDEKVGVLVKHNNAVQVIEYSELSPEQSHLRTSDGRLLFNLANISLFAFKMDFIEKVKNTYFKEMPLHKAFKRYSWKFERFIFDLLPFAERIETVVYPRHVCFSPLKNKEGKASPLCVQNDLVACDRRVLHELLGTPPPPEIEEIAQEYYYPIENTFKKISKVLETRSPYLQ